MADEPEIEQQVEINPNDPKYDEGRMLLNLLRGDHSERTEGMDVRHVGYTRDGLSASAYQRWMDTTAEKPDIQALPEGERDAAVRDTVASDLISDLVALNGGRDISDAAKTQIQALLNSNGAQAFGRKVGQEHEGITEILLTANGAGETPSFSADSGVSSVELMAALGPWGKLVQGFVNMTGSAPDNDPVFEAHNAATGRIIGAFEDALDIRGGYASEMSGEARIAIANVTGADVNGVYSFQGAQNPDQMAYFIDQGYEGISAADREDVSHFTQAADLGGGLEVTQANFENIVMPVWEGGENPIVRFETDAGRDAFLGHMAQKYADGVQKPIELAQEMMDFADSNPSITMAHEGLADPDTRVVARNAYGQPTLISGEGGLSDAEKAADQIVQAQLREDGRALPLPEAGGDVEAEVSDPRSAHAVEVFTADPVIASLIDVATYDPMHSVPEVQVAITPDPAPQQQQSPAQPAQQAAPLQSPQFEYQQN